MSDYSPAIILVRPQMGENIGAAARAMLNFGLTDLRIVAPRDGWPNQAAIDNGAGAFDHIEARVFDTLAEALADCHFSYATTARRRDLTKTALDLQAASKEAQARAGQHQKIAFVFGPERTGLENDDIALCHTLVHIPTNEAFSSLNLAQSVLLICYQWIVENGHTTIAPDIDLSPAPQAEFETFFTRLEQELSDHHFFREEGLKPRMAQNLRAMLMRTGYTEQELRTFHGMISALTGNKKPP